MHLPEIDFAQVRSLRGGGRRTGFEQFVCELAAADPPGDDAAFLRIEGAGGDGGVECIWVRADGTEHGWQAKYWVNREDVDKAQLDDSVETALRIHPRLAVYTIALPLDPTGPTGRRGKSLLEKIEGEDGWRAGWEAKARAAGMSVDFCLVWATDLTVRLQAIDTDGAQTRYWFDEDVLTDSWWADRLDDALEAARPKYIPELSIDVPAGLAVAALCQDPRWRTWTDDQVAATAKVISELDRYDNAPLVADLAHVKAEANTFLILLGAWAEDPSAEARELAREAVLSLRDLAANEEAREADALTAKHGSWDSVGWRQFQAEYQVSFPAAAVDALRDLLEQLVNLVDALASPIERIASSRGMVLTGAAGRGKTFLMCDIAAKRLADGRPTIIAHGKWFVDTNPLLQLRDILHLPQDLTGEQAVALLDQAGRTSGAPVLVVIDALNETRPRRMWRNWLDSFAATVGRFPHLRLVLSVRTHLRHEVLPEGLDLPEYEHRGFEGVEFDALTEYANYYGLEAPTSPPVQGEFDNPLFLRLLCEALTAGGRLSLEHSALGLSELVAMLLDNKNKAISDQLGAPVKDRLVHDALDRIVRAMAERDHPWLARPDALALTLEVWHERDAEKSLLEALIAEGLLAEEVTPDDTDVVTVSFERLGQHLTIEGYLQDVDSVDDLRTRLHTTQFHGMVAADPGMLEALSVVIAERFGEELPDLAIVDVGSATAAVVAGLPWRQPRSVSTSTEDAVRRALEDPVNFDSTIDMLFRLAPKPDHPMNAEWLTELLSTYSMAERDAVLIPWLHRTWGTKGSIDRLVAWTDGDLSNVGANTAYLWTLALLWCTGCSDRRVRDHATVASARLLNAHPSNCAQALTTMLQAADDDWITERAFDVVYTTLLQAGSPEQWAEVSEIAFSQLSAATPPLNAAIRDASRAIIEAAHDRGALPAELPVESARPPYPSAWPLAWPTEEAVAPYDTPAYPKLVYSVTGDDFFTYQITPCLDDRPVDIPAAARRVVLDVVELGYDPELHQAFDSYVMREYGGGRGKPAWIERIGKKYQWIALARLLGNVSDHTERQRTSWDPPPPPTPGPQGQRLLHLDPSVLGVTSRELTRAWVPSHDPLPTTGLPNEEWVARADFPDVAVATAEVEGAPHIVLTGSYEWRAAKAQDGTQRIIWLQINALIVNRDLLSSLVDEISPRDLSGHDVHRSPMVASGFVGEYPFGFHVQSDLHLIEHEQSDPFAVSTAPASFDLLGEYGYAPDELSTVSLPAPAPTFFLEPGVVRWDGYSAWRDTSGEAVAAVRHTSGGGQNELTIDAQWLYAWLDEHDKAIVWVESAGRDVYGTAIGARQGRFLRSRVRQLGAGGTVVDSPPVDEHVRRRDN